MTKKVVTTPYGDRNVWCPHYAKCLDKCIESGAGGFTCHGCQYELDHAWVPQDQVDLAEDCRCCMALLVSIFKRVTVQEAISRVG